MGIRKSWEECYADPPHTLYIDDQVEDANHGQRYVVRYLVMRGKFSLTAYVGVPKSSPAAGWPYELVPIDVHGGLTFSASGHDPWPVGWWWYGWDYAHAYDRTWWELEMRKIGYSYPRLGKERKWTIDLVAPEARRAAEQMLSLEVMRWQPEQSKVREYQEEEKRRREWLASQGLSNFRQDMNKLNLDE